MFVKENEEEKKCILNRTSCFDCSIPQIFLKSQILAKKESVCMEAVCTVVYPPPGIIGTEMRTQNLYLFSEKCPSWIFDRVLNTPPELTILCKYQALHIHRLTLS